MLYKEHSIFISLFKGTKAMHDLSKATSKEALHIAKQKSGLTENEIAARLGVSLSVVKRYFQREDSYLPSLEMIPRLCAVFGNTLLLRWMEVQTEKEEMPDRPTMLAAVLRASRKLEDLRTRLEKKESVPLSMREMEEAVDALTLECACMREILPGRASGKRGANGLLCPWWKFWYKYK